MANMELEGMDNLIRKIEDMGKAGTRIENKALKKAGELIVEEAKNNVPVKTEKLKKGLKVSGVRKKGGNKFVLAGIQKGDNSKIFYGKFLEFGTSKMKARPFMGPAYESKKEEAKGIIKDELRRGLGL
ncbi:HK97-gp10 family putative phage morphogenesis protein [Clostridium botulinum]|uniref:Phage protein, HK97 gp10 family n=1 Tax=Clostridium botulinum (strain Langeland / NCTC 10281 / Type F) TaxID=441772 RepID=A7GI66_CLOBL|nr:HK97-gp10 family putative phage morphogenesis protein [Clostridium botulinum]ABS42576.1 phage protein, HK97 gp10 family [Clostridium botulinum F str. Langeland]ADG00839.1 phage protein, HK97 gp10 family [Clostridium botulinum F str. 230613]KKM40656.1 phage protein, HK97 gp10 family [Clostridium botulinum]MBY6794370.1 HK97 gp10 family phage protein [Clostridium botulinum]MBY6938158.1 HK97 gp10 family phage protein [Clostridium botulinum]